MQTFLTSTNSEPLRAAQETFAMLDRARLGKQRVEVLQLLNGAYPNHPASLMWKWAQHALTAYGIICCKMWIKRGHPDTVLPQLQERRRELLRLDVPLVWPWWYGHPAMVRTHQTKLYHKGSVRWVNQAEQSSSRHLVMRLPYLWPDPDEDDTFRLSAAEAKRADWEIPSSWGYDATSRIVVPR